MTSRAFLAVFEFIAALWLAGNGFPFMAVASAFVSGLLVVTVAVDLIEKNF